MILKLENVLNQGAQYITLNIYHFLNNYHIFKNFSIYFVYMICNYQLHTCLDTHAYRHIPYACRYVYTIKNMTNLNLYVVLFKSFSYQQRFSLILFFSLSCSLAQLFTNSREFPQGFLHWPHPQPECLGFVTALS